MFASNTGPLPPGLTQGELRNAVPAYPPPAPAQWPDEAIYRSVRLEALLAVGGLARELEKPDVLRPRHARCGPEPSAQTRHGQSDRRQQSCKEEQGDPAASGGRRGRHPGCGQRWQRTAVGRSPAAARRTAPRRIWCTRGPVVGAPASRQERGEQDGGKPCRPCDRGQHGRRGRRGRRPTHRCGGRDRLGRRQLGYLPGLPGGGRRLPPVRRRARRWP